MSLAFAPIAKTCELNVKSYVVLHPPLKHGPAKKGLQPFLASRRLKKLRNFLCWMSSPSRRWQKQLMRRTSKKCVPLRGWYGRPQSQVICACTCSYNIFVNDVSAYLLPFHNINTVCMRELLRGRLLFLTPVLSRWLLPFWCFTTTPGTCFLHNLLASCNLQFNPYLVPSTHFVYSTCLKLQVV